MEVVILEVTRQDDYCTWIANILFFLIYVDDFAHSHAFGDNFCVFDKQVNRFWYQTLLI